MEFKGTPGTWEVIELNISDFKQICIGSDERSSVLSHIYLPNYEITKEEQANAKLMAKSPELLDRLHKTNAHIISLLGRDCVTDVVMERCLRAAVEQNEKVIKEAVGE
jgi:hypothetical protein